MFSSKRKSDRETQQRHQATSLFGSGSTFNGTVEAANDLRVDGKVIGAVYSQAKVVTGESSQIKGPIKGVNVEIRGQVTGDIYATENLSLKSSAIIHGNIYAKKLLMEEGARISGQCQVGSSIGSIDRCESEMKLNTEDSSTKLVAVG